LAGRKLIGRNPANLIVGWSGQFLFFVVPRQFSQDISEWPENQILIPDWPYFHCPGTTLLMDRQGKINTLSNTTSVLRPISKLRQQHSSGGDQTCGQEKRKMPRTNPNWEFHFFRQWYCSFFFGAILVHNQNGNFSFSP